VTQLSSTLGLRSRRAFLTAAGLTAVAALAGCTTTASGPNDGGGTPTPTPDGGNGGAPGSGSGSGSDAPDGGPGDGSGDGGDGAAGTRPEGTGGPGVSIVSRDSAPALAVVPSVAVVDEAATETNPPRLRVTLTNTGDEAVTVGEGRAAFFAYRYATDGQLVLLPSDGESSYPAEPDCWRLEEPIAITEEYRTLDIEAGESASRTLSVYGGPELDGCLPVGEFRFETSIAVAPRGQLPDGESSRSASWGFAVVLE
jgi:hypothetical protein